MILADEPTGSLDRKNGEKVITILEQMREEGRTVVLVTHNDELKKRGGRIVEL